MSKIIAAVFDFNEKVIGVAETLALNPLTAAQAEWTLTALREEVTELEEAIAKQDVVGMVDALVDGIYFAVGTFKKMGLTREQSLECFMAVHNANMNKKRGGKAERGNFEEDAIKPADFVSPEAAIAKILFGE